MKTLNVRLLAILVACGFVLAIGVFGLNRYQRHRHARFFLDKAMELKEQEEILQRAEAAEYFRRYIHFTNDTDAKEELGFLLADLGQPGRAVLVLEEVLRDDGMREKVRRKLVDIYIAQRRFPDAREHLKILQDDAPKDAELLQLLGQCQVEDEEYESAEDSLQEAIEYAPQELDAYVGLARLLRLRMERDEDADAWMNKMVEQNPNSARAYLLRGEYLRGIGRPDEAAKDAVKSLELSPDDHDALLLSAQCEMDKENYDKARRHAKRVVDLSPEYVAAYDVLSTIEIRAGDRQAAKDAIEDGLDATGGNPHLLWSKANYLIDEMAVDQAENVVERLRDTGAWPPLVGYLRGRIAFSRQQWETARLLFEQVRADLATRSRWSHLARNGDLWIAECCRRLGKHEQQKAALMRARAANPGSIPTRQAMIKTLESEFALGPAIHETKALARMENAPKTIWIDLARLQFKLNMTRSELERNWREVEESLAKAEEATPDAVLLPILRAEMCMARDRQEEAVQILQKARDKEPDNWTFWNALISIAQRQQDWKRVKGLLDEAGRKLGDSVVLRLARGRFLVASDAENAAEELKKLSQATEVFSERELVPLWSGLAVLSRLVGDYQQAIKLYLMAAEKQPNDLQLRRPLFEIAARAGDDATMKKALEEIGKIEQKGAIWHYCQAIRQMVLAEKGQSESLDEALKHFNQARILRPSWARVYARIGKVYDQKGDWDLAIENYTEAVNRGSRDPRSISRLAQLLDDLGRVDEAKRMYAMLANQPGFVDPRARFRQIQILFEEGDIEQGLDGLRRLAKDSENYGDHLNLGRVLTIQGLQAKKDNKAARAEQMLDEAEKSIRRAVELAPEAPNAWTLLILFLHNNEREEEAKQAIDEVKQKISQDKLPLVLARIYQGTGRRAQAERQYKLAIKQASNDTTALRAAVYFYLQTGEPQKAESLLKDMTAAEKKPKPEDLAWARRRLATIIFSRGGFHQRQRALKLVDQNLRMREPSVQDQRLKARLLSVFATRSQRKAAIGLLEKLVSRPRPSSEDRFLLAKLLAADGNWPKASRIMRDDLLSTEAVKPAWLEFYIKSLMERKEYRGARSFLRRLERLAPQSFAVANLQSQVLAGLKQPEESIEVLRKFLDKPDAQPADRPTRLRLVGKALERLGEQALRARDETTAGKFNSEADVVYREYIKGRPEHSMLMVSFLGRQGRLDEALDLAEEAWGKGDPIPLAATCVSLLNNTKATPEHGARVEKVLNDAVRKQGRVPPLLLATAELRTIQKHYEDAEALYREVLKKDGENVVALNNLAVFLALRKIKLNDALQLINKAIEISGPVATLRDSRASVYTAKGQWNEAVAEMEAAIEDAAKPVRYLHLAQAYYAGKKKDAAVAALIKAHELGLRIDHLQPLERPGYRELCEALK